VQPLKVVTVQCIVPRGKDSSSGTETTQYIIQEGKVMSGSSGKL